ncbi:hypothetical protein NAEGRDRAFT_80835 [Naegleria gruberi]|uniref:Tubulin tyrosine ligase n=1 Tax=Naegleria gruberi TaxID=5762 RepID=D2VQ09_NAEGR|nr:uncharacterized protein NAEGRDRAFT_80835 [Naegleria gruberi]EFC41096.1 hypothetical protein NAEGRDRAFT_80835 [Naegleria gruberi]|eukprot:XP_002673840.1 hypothetical protein NAEGRDRAFT_80835 [Naegleria gruberi strain NEG-M]
MENIDTMEYNTNDIDTNSLSASSEMEDTPRIEKEEEEDVQNASTPSSPASPTDTRSESPSTGRESSSNPPIIVDLTNCKYNVVRDACLASGWKIRKPTSNAKDFTVFWMDQSSAPDRVMKLRTFQKINHFPAMGGICRKIPLARNMKRLKKSFPDEFSFLPSSWVLPQEYCKFKSSKKIIGKTYIIKPTAGCQGKGIVITQDPTDAERYGDCVVQLYVDRPFLIDGYKFDLRVYALVLCIDPLKIFMYQDGLVRICTEKYKAPTQTNIKTECMHLTNYSVNKKSDGFEYDPNNFSVGSKRNFAFLNDYLEGKGYSPEKVWGDVGDIINKTVLSIYPQLVSQYKTSLSQKHGDFVCFEILGFDVLLDEKMNPWLLEVNHSPSFNTDTPLDRHVKFNLLTETMKMLAIDPNDRIVGMKLEKALSKERITGNANEEVDQILKSMASREELVDFHTKKEDDIMSQGKYKRIYPSSDNKMEKYSKFIEKATAEFMAAQSHFNTASSSAKQVSFGTSKTPTLRSKSPTCVAGQERIKTTNDTERRSKSVTSTRAGSAPKTGERVITKAKSAAKIMLPSAEITSKWLEKRKGNQRRQPFKMATTNLEYKEANPEVLEEEIDEELLELMDDPSKNQRQISSKGWSP